MSNFTFNNYVCVGDTSTIEQDGYTITAKIKFDADSRPDDCDDECYSEEQREAWRNDDWFYCGVVLSVSCNDVNLHEHAASLWGIEANFPGSDNSHIAECADDILQEALKVANDERERILWALK